MFKLGASAAMKQKSAILWPIVVALLAAITSCARQQPSQQASDPRLDVLQEQTKVLMTLAAQQDFNEVFKSTFNPEKAQLVVGADLKKLLEERKKSLNLVPEDIRTLITGNRGTGLVIEDAVPGKKGGGMHPVVYMRAPRFGGSRFFLRLDADPCGDGNPVTCDFCTGCSGETEPGGTIKTCVCAESCDTCRLCPNC